MHLDRLSDNGYRFAMDLNLYLTVTGISIQSLKSMVKSGTVGWTEP